PNPRRCDGGRGRRFASCGRGPDMAHAPVTRFRHLFLANLREVKGRLLFAALCTLGATAAELLKPWPLKIILDHVILDKPVPRALRALQGLFPAGKVPPLLEAAAPFPRGTSPAARARSEEHTSELQSLRHPVCRLLLEKKTTTSTSRPLPAMPCSS